MTPEEAHRLPPHPEIDWREAPSPAARMTLEEKLEVMLNEGLRPWEIDWDDE